jgi:hypothetical protein
MFPNQSRDQARTVLVGFRRTGNGKSKDNRRSFDSGGKSAAFAQDDNFSGSAGRISGVWEEADKAKAYPPLHKEQTSQILSSASRRMTN